MSELEGQWQASGRAMFLLSGHGRRKKEGGTKARRGKGGKERNGVAFFPVRTGTFWRTFSGELNLIFYSF